MNHYILIRRLRGPAVLLLGGTIALLHQMGLIPHPWHLFWALLFILIGCIMLAERTVLSLGGGVAAGYPATPYAPGPYPGAPVAQNTTADSTANVPAHSNDLGNDPNGGQS